MNDKPTDRQVQGRRNATVALLAVGVVVAMVGLSYASVPLYRLFCQVTGFGGTTQVADAAPGSVSERRITVQFNADTAGGIPWQFRPQQREVTLNVGEQGLAFYAATNLSESRVVGTSTFNVTPLKAGAYFNKIDCFCFTEQALEPGASAEFPVSFFVDPAIEQDPNMRDVKTITLSYTFFQVEQDEDKTAANLTGGS